MPIGKLETLVQNIERLSPGKRLRLAALLMEAGKIDLAIAVAENVVVEHQAATLFREMAERTLRS